MSARRCAGWFRCRLEGALFALLAAALLPAYLFAALKGARGRAALARAFRRWPTHILRGFAEFRNAWWAQAALEGWRTQARYIVLLEVLELMAAWRAATPSRTGAQRVLIVQLGHVGDVLAVEPLVRGWKAGRPQDKVAILVGPWSQGWLAGRLGADEVHVYRPAVAQFSRSGAFPSLAAETSTLAELAGKHFDCLVTAGNTHWIDLVLVAALQPADWCGVAPGERMHYGSGNRLHVRYDTSLREPARAAGLARAMGIDIADVTPRIAVSDELRARGRTFWPQPGNPLRIAVAPGAGWPGKIWPAERFADLLRRTSGTYRADVVLLGGPDERAIGEQIAAAAGSGVVSLVGTTSLEDAAAILSCSDVLVTNDNGLMHLAAAEDVPVVALFGPTSPAQWGPSTRICRVVKTEHDCSGCIPWHPRAACIHGGACMKSITVERVEQALDEVLKTCGATATRS
jgi:lipopolysaccharide heptosyltransferase II